MAERIRILKKPTASEIYMLAGWHQWADAGSISSGLPEYLVHLTEAEKIAEINDDGFYIFQIPGTHHLLRPVVKMEEGHIDSLETRKNEFFYWEKDDKGLVIFLGEEPHMNIDQYAETFFKVVQEFGVRRVIAFGGVYGPVPYDLEREMGCLYSLPQMKAELEKYAVRFSNYEGGSSIGTYLAYHAERAQMEFLAFYSFVPAYDFGQSNVLPQGVRIENDYKAWHEVMRRCNHMLHLDLNLNDLEQRSFELIETMDDKIGELEEKYPQLKARDYLDQVAEAFVERPFMPLDDFWERELRDLFGDGDE
ncbi:MAG: PAC2 family protein [Ardenticatenaceae bacterium]|nr:PAC2 family protein [Ardenticatenaceae bacterium]